MKTFLLSLVILSAFAFTACIAPLATPTPVPATATPVTQPTSASSASTSYVDQLEHVGDPELVNKTWQWEKRDPNGNQSPTITVPNPEKYTIIFSEDGTFSALMDCNSASGRYATSSPGSIFMELESTPLTECGQDSLAGDMANMFGPAQSYRYEEDGSTIVFAWAAGGPIDTFRVAP